MCCVLILALTIILEQLLFKECEIDSQKERKNKIHPPAPFFIAKQNKNLKTNFLWPNILLPLLFFQLDSSIAFKRFSNKIVRLLYPDGMDADKLKEAESLVSCII